MRLKVDCIYRSSSRSTTAKVQRRVRKQYSSYTVQGHLVATQLSIAPVICINIVSLPLRTETTIQKKYARTKTAAIPYISQLHPHPYFQVSTMLEETLVKSTIGLAHLALKVPCSTSKSYCSLMISSLAHLNHCLEQRTAGENALMLPQSKSPDLPPQPIFSLHAVGPHLQPPSS